MYTFVSFSPFFIIISVLLGKVCILPEARIPCQPREALVCSQHYPQSNAIRGQLVSNRFRLNNEKISSSEQRFLVGFNLKHAHVSKLFLLFGIAEMLTVLPVLRIPFFKI